jgi:hypothetical protein
MLWTLPTRSKILISQVTDRIVNSGQLSHADYLRLMSAILSDKDITESERNQINRVFDYVQTGRVRFNDI